MRDVEEADPLPDGSVLYQNPLVLHRHLPPSEVDHLRAELSVKGVKRGSLERRRLHGHRHEKLEVSTKSRKAESRENPDPRSFGKLMKGELDLPLWRAHCSCRG
jgi:hypothetical protein